MATVVAIVFSGNQCTAVPVISCVQETSPTQVVCTLSGSLDTTGMTLAGGGNESISSEPHVDPNAGRIVTGSGGTTNVDRYFGAVNFFSYGTGNIMNATAGSGPRIGIANATNLFLPVGYVSGQPLPVSTATYAGATLASLGMTADTTTTIATWGAAGAAQRINVTTNSVPEPSPILCLLAVGLCVAGYRKYRTRAVQSSPN